MRPAPTRPPSPPTRRTSAPASTTSRGPVVVEHDPPDDLDRVGRLDQPEIGGRLAGQDDPTRRRSVVEHEAVDRELDDESTDPDALADEGVEPAELGRRRGERLVVVRTGRPVPAGSADAGRGPAAAGVAPLPPADPDRAHARRRRTTAVPPRTVGRRHRDRAAARSRRSWRGGLRRAPTTGCGRRPGR